jgi:hypothetical protein
MSFERLGTSNYGTESAPREKSRVVRGPYSVQPANKPDSCDWMAAVAVRCEPVSAYQGKYRQFRAILIRLVEDGSLPSEGNSD